MKVLKDARVVLLLVLTISSLLLLSYPYVAKRSGAEVVDVGPGARCTGISAGSVITQAAGGDVKNADDFRKIVKSIRAGGYITMVADGVPGGCAASADGDVGLQVGNAKSNRLEMSPDIQGSTKTVYSLAGNHTDKDVIRARNILQQRISSLNLQYAEVGIKDGNITITAGLYDNLAGITAACRLDGRVVTALSLQDGKGSLKIGNNTYGLLSQDGHVEVDGHVFPENHITPFEGMMIEFSNATNSSVIETIHFFNNSDVVSSFGYGGMNRDQASGQFYFSIPIVPFEGSVSILKGIVKNLGTGFSGGQLALNGKMIFYLDGVLLSDLPMPYTLLTQPIGSLSIIGIGNSERTVGGLRAKSLMCLGSRPLDIGLERVGSIPVQASNEKAFYYVMLSSVLLAVLIPSLMAVKNRSAREIMPMLVLTQVPITVGAAMFTQLAFPTGWVVDMQTAFGLLLSILLNQISIMFDQIILKNKLLKYLDMAVFAIGFLALFSVFKGFGLSLLAGLILKGVIFRPVVKAAG